MSGIKKIRVGLIYGGKSGEHEVSLSTALAVMKAFDFDKYEIAPFYITKDGEWRNGPLLQAPVEHTGLLQYDADETKPMGAAIMPLFAGGTDVSLKGSVQGIDVMFPLLHGTFGEDGTIQGLFEIANVPYVGAGVLASAVGMDKVIMKKLFAQAGLPQCMYRYFTRKQWEKDANYHTMEVEISLGYPCFIKPANLGSSVGVSKARNREELIAAIELALRYDRKVIVEEFIDAREIEVSVLGNEEPKASVPGEITSSSEFYDYQAKYIDGNSAMMIPANIPDELTEELRTLAVRAFQAIDGSGLSRVDFFVRKQDNQIMINEVNTMPGFTPFSMYPLMWRETGLSYQDLLDQLIQLALERYEEKQQIDYGNNKPETVAKS
ncbi:D-alanine--D-alanine ligase A [Paenibacillus selenitireducens]|uniref:D-alanine--D-alanine ligase n=1 Tax=Paenibacillus selenitireducens TaxID=1324314 RepID=A0A1T2X6N9_9BACL|nr:D-alanine--D-alanine ligase [Paenibacillus selenitireducens]OPA75544.1 D-alanine--D-alanine ligase A [Paenibacillus selenitireducens]